MSDAIFKWCPTGHENGMIRACVEIDKTRTLSIELIQVGSLQKEVAVTDEITVTLVISHPQNNILACCFF